MQLTYANQPILLLLSDAQQLSKDELYTLENMELQIDHAHMYAGPAALDY